MVEYAINLDLIFSSLADPTRRDILKRVAKKELTVSQIAQSYKLSFAAVSKHLIVLEKARLITKRKDGKQHLVRLFPDTLKDASKHLRHYQTLWQDRFAPLEKLLAHQLAKEKIHSSK